MFLSLAMFDINNEAYIFEIHILSLYTEDR